MPLTAKGQKIMANMKAEYGPEKGERVFYASRNAGRISGVDPGHQDGGEVREEQAPARVFSPAGVAGGFSPAGFPGGGRHGMGLKYGAQGNPLHPRSVEMMVRQLTGVAPGTPEQQQAGGRVGGLVDHDQDPELPALRDDASLHDMLQQQEEPAYLATIRRLMEGQRRLDAMHPVHREMLRRYWLGGLTYWLGGSVGK